jgi:class 3 adenylate cyclase
VPTRTRTVVFTDLKDYTSSVSRADRQGVRDLVATHKEMVPPVLERHGGVVVKNLGDSFLAVFNAATDAVRAALELVESARELLGFGIKVGLATGDIEEIDGDCFGDAVNLANRILSKTPAGEVWLSEATLLCMNQAEIAWERVGRFSLKGIPYEVPVIRAVPAHRAYLPEPVAQATREHRLVRIELGDPMPPLPARSVILLEGFEPDSRALRETVDSLPVVDPADLWLVVYTISPLDRYTWTRAGRGLVVGVASTVRTAVEETLRPPSHVTGSDTIIIDMAVPSIFELVMAGLALPAVPMSEVVAGYTYDLLADGRWVNRSDHAIARVDCSPGAVKLTVLTPGVHVRGRQVTPGEQVTLDHGDEIRAPAGSVQYLHLGDATYVGLLVADTLARLGVAPGQQVEVGREPNFPGLALPDRRGQENIRWCPGVRAAKARESGFTLDRALAGRRQAAVALGPGGASLISLHERCPTFVMRDDGLERVSLPTSVQSGDLIVTGTSVISVREPAP